MLAHQTLSDLENSVLARYANADTPSEVAVFYRHEAERRLHCEVKVYFSPASRDVAQEFDAEPCEKPSPHGLSLLAGSEASWVTLFPEFCQ